MHGSLSLKGQFTPVIAPLLTMKGLIGLEKAKIKITLEERIYGLSTLWKEAAYNFAYWDEHKGLDWNDAYLRALPLVISAEDPLHYYAELMKFVALLKDGHTYVTIPEEIKPPYRAPFFTSYIEDRHVLSAVPKDSGIPLFLEIQSVNGMNIEEYLEHFAYPYIWHEKPDGKFFHGLLGYLIGCQAAGEIRIGTDHGEFACSRTDDADLPDDTMDVTHPALRHAHNVFSSTALDVCILENGVAYIELPTFGSDRLRDELYRVAEECGECKGFLIDIRQNRGGSSRNGNAVARLFFDGAFPEDPAKSPVHIPSFAAYGRYRDIDKLNFNDPWEKKIYDVCTHRLYDEQTDWVQPDDNCPIHFRQPVVILSECTTASAAESFLVTMKYKNRAAIVGNRSYGSNGQPFMGNLPGGGSYAINTMKCCTLDGISYHNAGIEPDLFVLNTAEDYRCHFDRIFDAGLRYLKTL